MTSRSRCRSGVRKSGPRVRSGPRKGLRRCKKSRSRSRSASRCRSKGPCPQSRAYEYNGVTHCLDNFDPMPALGTNPHFNAKKTECPISTGLYSWKTKVGCVRSPRNRALYWLDEKNHAVTGKPEQYWGYEKYPGSGEQYPGIRASMTPDMTVSRTL